MSRRNGDRSRFNRKRRRKIARREVCHAVAVTMKEKADAAVSLGLLVAEAKV